MYEFAKSILFKMDAEAAHRVTIDLMRKVPLGLWPHVQQDYPQLKTILWDRVFPNPVGLAAGFDKNAEVISPLFKLGFGFVEVGTVTLKPQSGNPKPRIFRNQDQQAVINRMGFPNIGLDGFMDNLSAFLSRKPRPFGVLGINIGMNKDQTTPSLDYTALIKALGPMADYLTINISSPNTPGLRNLQEKGPLGELIQDVQAERRRSCGPNPPPILIKFAPDLTDEQIQDIAEVLLAYKVDGIIVSNTTLTRPESLPAEFAVEKGGLSGAPLTRISTEAIRKFYAATNGQIPIIGVGGIGNADDAYAKVKAGASLIQIYSALVFQGPQLIKSINDGLVTRLKADGYKTLSQAVGADHTQKSQGEERNVQTA